MSIKTLRKKLMLGKRMKSNKPMPQWVRNVTGMKKRT
jgi:ribosomal protein L39E